VSHLLRLPDADAQKTFKSSWYGSENPFIVMLDCLITMLIFEI
jgi:hypothetical protein